VTRLVASLAALATAIAVASVPAGADSGKWNVGPAADVAAVRADIVARPGDKVGGVHVVGDYALTQVYMGTEASGMWVYKRTTGHHWNRIAGGGGTADLSGVPKSIARQLCSGWPKGYGC
jgi:hypothetical protein